MTQAPTAASDVERACAAYAKATGYYAEFHPGWSSPSADKMRAGMRAALAALSQPAAHADVERAALLCEENGLSKAAAPK